MLFSFAPLLKKNGSFMCQKMHFWVEKNFHWNKDWNTFLTRGQPILLVGKISSLRDILQKMPIHADS